MEGQRKIELLAPARNADTGIEAIRHGADAVYIGAPKFGAREAAGNSIDDIARLVDYAHLFGAKVYATLNTILYDSELAEAKEIACRLYDIGTDALLIQDAAYLEMNLPPIALHASTQCDNRTPGKIQRLYDQGFTTAVLARELSIQEISDIHQSCPDMRLEAFIHGALCVSLSGRCYASQHCFGRSANRGECAQFCRLPFDLETDAGKKILRQKHLLSLRDLNRTDWLEQIIDAGVSSLKIEGRLKDTEYVKNITAWYRQRLDQIFQRRQEFCRASYGKVSISFQPKPEKSFNRGFTDYFMSGRSLRMANPASPKSIGEPVGEVRDADRRSITVSGHKHFNNGDGLCYFDEKGVLCGFRVNRVEGQRLFPATMPQDIKKHTPLFRNHDEDFARALSKPTAERSIKIDFRLTRAENGYLLEAEDEMSRRAEATIDYPYEASRSPQTANIIAQLSKLGGTAFRAGEIEANCGEGFIPSSLLADARRRVTDAIAAQRSPERTESHTAGKTKVDEKIDYTYNVANLAAGQHYKRCGAKDVAPAWEMQPPKDAPIMTCRYCLRNELGMCLRKKESPRDKLFLRLADGRRFRLEFNCKGCCMKIYPDE